MTEDILEIIYTEIVLKGHHDLLVFKTQGQKTEPRKTQGHSFVFILHSDYSHLLNTSLMVSIMLIVIEVTIYEVLISASH